MSNTKSKASWKNENNFFYALVLAAIASASAIAGSWITGNRMIESQRIQSDRALEIMSGTNAQAELAVIREKSAEYILMINVILMELSSEPIDKTTLLESMQPFFKKSVELVFYVPPELGNKTVKLNAAIVDRAKSIGHEDSDQWDKQLSGAMQDWLAAYFDEVEKYRHHTMPAKFKDDLLNILFQSLLKSDEAQVTQ